MSSSSTSRESGCVQRDLVLACALGTLDPNEVPAVEAHVATCSDCRQDMVTVSRIVGSFAFWPTDVLRPSPSLWGRVARRIAAEAGGEPVPRAASRWTEPAWEQVAPGISCKLLATDTDRNRVSMLVRLAPGVEYPPHLHSGVEELHLLDGELWIDEKKLLPGDYNRAEPGTSDSRVWSETGCTCVLVTSSHDVLT
jgi:anti-sigma factor ChrR (cupin superfamily)